MRLTFTKSFSKIESDWARLYGLSDDNSPFLEPSAFRIAYKYFFPYYLKNKSYPLFAVLTDNGDIRAIIPLIKSKKGLQLFGDENGFNECSLLYDSDKSLSDSITLLLKQHPRVSFSKVDERSPLYRQAEMHALCGGGGNALITNNISIGFGSDYESWFKTLSSSVRQNIRTAYNRLNSDGCSLSVEIFSKESTEPFPLDEIINLYCERHRQRYGVRTSRLKRWLLKHISFATRYYLEADNRLTVLLRINGRAAAFLSGLYNDSRLIVPRLSICADFNRYSPGMILVCETIRHLIVQTPIRILDLSKGEEQYKFKLGGQIHHSLSIDAK